MTGVYNPKTFIPPVSYTHLREYKVPTASGIIAGAALTGMAILMFSIYQAAL